LLDVLNRCNPKPVTLFCIAVEEIEAWLLGDIPAVLKAYPQAKDEILCSYENDDICGTWEVLADALLPGGAEDLKKKRWQTAGAKKSEWAKAISPHMDVENNKSTSFCYFRDKLRSLV
jgi:hypothetical protein